ncbi:hypothetical protein ORM34_20335 [Bacillus cereus]|nr:hypothetical protein [Bacillus cereus]
MSLWDDTFKIEMTFKGRNNQIKKRFISYKGSLKSAIRSITEKYRTKHMVVNFYNSEGAWLKEIGW